MVFYLEISVLLMTEYKQKLINQTLPGYIQYLYNNYKYLAKEKIYVNELFKNCSINKLFLY
jgi:hypothetical protein